MNKTLITFLTILFCLTSSVGWSETWDELVERDGIYFKKFTDVPFNGKMDNKGLIKNSKINLYEQGSIKNGMKDGSWVRYYEMDSYGLKVIIRMERKKVLGFIIMIMDNYGLKNIIRMIS